MLINFTKMHGAGNDFIVIDDRNVELEGREVELATKLCHRRYSVGADGLILLRQASLPGCDLEMYYLNSDGSYAGMCGNGIRCVAWYFYRKIDDSRRELNVEVANEARAVLIQPGQDKEGCGASVTVNMRIPSFRLKDIPANVEGLSGDDFCVNKEIRLLPDFSPLCTLVNMGNPHCVIFVEDDEITDELVLGRGREIERQVRIFPERVNVEFVAVMTPVDSDAETYLLKMRVWERGIGETWACASGASAAVVAGVLAGRIPAENDIAVDLPGGKLIVRWDGEGTPVTLTGNAEFSFEGSVDV